METNLGDSEKHAHKLNEMLFDLLYSINLAGDLNSALAALVEQAPALLPADGVAVMWIGGDHLEVLASGGKTAPLRGLSLPAAQMGAARLVLDSRRPVLVADTLDAPHWQQVPGEERVRSWIGAPLRANDWTLGLVEWTSAEAGYFGEKEIEIAGEIARLVAPALHRAQLLDDARRHLRDAAAPAADSLVRDTDPALALQPLVDEAREFTGARQAFIFLGPDLYGNEDRLHCVAAAGDQRDSLLRVVLRGDGSFGNWRMSRAQSGGRSDREIMADMGVSSPLILPLRAAGDQVGMIGVSGPRHGPTFGRDAIRVMTHLASQASVIVEHLYARRPAARHYDYEMVFRASPLGVAVLSITGEILACNPALAGLLSRSDRHLIGAGLHTFLVHGDGQRLLRALEEAVITGERRQVDGRVRTGQADDRHLRISLAVGQLSGDQSGSAVALMEDVSALKILERERVEHLRELREKHTQLRDLDQLKSRFVSNVSHELRTPLAVIKLYATLARKGRPEKRDHYLTTIEQETHRLETMVENILDLSRMDRQMLRVNPELLAAEEIISQVLQVYEETAQKHSVELRNRVEGPLPKIWADKNHLIQMLTNLVNNAIKYTPHGGQVWVAARETGTNAHPTLEIAVGDTGVGIPEDEQEKVFERFYRGSNNTPGSTGTGLGLAIVQELMLQHGGRVTLHSRKGEGSIFALHFPLIDGERMMDEHKEA
ncbi:MAG: GAF domain-containing protein [Anaerolineae bacterium]|nr:GAF domain-containing protein [Anaerolineae bacterium]